MSTATKRGNATRRNGDELTAYGRCGTFDVRPYWLETDGTWPDNVESRPFYQWQPGPGTVGTSTTGQIGDPPPTGYAVYRRVPGDYPNSSEHRHISDHLALAEAISAAELEAITQGVAPGGSIRIRAGGECGPENLITVDEWGGVVVECEGKRVKIDTQDPGPGGVTIFVDGEHEDGSP